MIAIGSDVDEQAINAAIRATVMAAREVVRTVPEDEADDPLLSVSAFDEGPGSIPLATSFWIPVVNFFHDASDVSLGVLQRLISGEPIAWSDLGSGVAGQVRLVVAGDPAQLARLLGAGPAAPTIETQPVDAIPGLVNADKTVLALVPFTAVDHRVRSVAVDGVAPTLKVGDPETYPLVEKMYVLPGEAEGEEAQLRDRLVADLQAAYPPAPPTLRMLATGDVIFGRCTWTRTEATGTNNAAFVDIADFLRAADFTMGNMDNTLSDSITPQGCGSHTVNFVSPTRYVEGLTFAGYDLITQGSNHVRDFGPQYVIETIQALESHGVAHAGAGANVAEAQAATIYEVGGFKLAVVSGVNIDVADNSGYWATADSAGSAPIDEASIAASIAAVRDQVDFVIFAPQWGTEYVAHPSDKQIALKEAALNAGADIIVGNHPHVPQAAVVNDPRGFVAWALGNFVYDQNWCYWTERSNILEVVFGGGKVLSVRFVPVKVEEMYRPRVAEGSDRTNILTLVELASTGQLPPDYICNQDNLTTSLAPFVQ
ncbi:MAG: CapA family protein [Dehalococcoidia bacterium]